MNTQEYFEKDLRRVQISLYRAQQKPNVSEDEIAALKEKEKHLLKAIRALNIVENLGKWNHERKTGKETQIQSKAGVDLRF